MLVSESPNRVQIYLSTAVELVRMLAARGRFFLIPLVMLLLLTGIILLLAEVIPVISPFVYTLF